MSDEIRLQQWQIHKAPRLSSRGFVLVARAGGRYGADLTGIKPHASFSVGMNKPGSRHRGCADKSIGQTHRAMGAVDARDEKE